MKEEWKQITKQELENHFNSGLWHKDIALIYNVTERTVRTKCQKLNLILDRKNKSKPKETKNFICKVCGKIYHVENDGYCGANCRKLESNLKDLEHLDENTSELGKQIIELRKLGKSMKDISIILGCSKSTVSYHCSRTTKTTHKNKIERSKNEKSYLYLLSKRLTNFKLRKFGIGKHNTENYDRKITASVSFFKNRNKMKVEKNYTYKEAIDHLGGLQTKCYLTGRPIDITKDSYCLDHIQSVSNGGSNELENMGITIPIANASKSSMNLDEYLNLCKEVLENFGYIVEKK